MPTPPERVFGLRHLAAVAFVLIARNADAKPWAAWLIDPQSNDSWAIEISDDPATGDGSWRLVARNGEVLTQVPAPKIPKGYSLNLGQCKIDGAFRPDVVAIVKHRTGVQWSRIIAEAWIADANTKTFAVADPKRMVCLNDGFGL